MRLPLVLISCGLMTCSYGVSETVRGNIPLDVQTDHASAVVLTAALVEEENQSRLLLYDAKGDALVASQSFRLPDVDAMMTTDLVGHVDLHGKEPFSIWLLGTFAGGYQVVNYGPEGMRTSARPDATDYDYNAPSSQLETFTQASGTLLWMSQTHTWMPVTKFYSYHVSAAGLQESIPNLFYAGCGRSGADGPCIAMQQNNDALSIGPLRQDGGFGTPATFITLPYHSTGWNNNLKFPVTTMRVHCGPDDDGRHRMFFTNAIVDYPALVSGADLQPSAPASSAISFFKQPGYLICSPDSVTGPVLWFDANRTLHLLDVVSGEAKTIDHSFGAVPQGGSLVGFRARGAATKDGWLFAYAKHVRTETVYDCKTIFGEPACERRVYYFTTEVLRISLDGRVTSVLSLP